MDQSAAPTLRELYTQQLGTRGYRSDPAQLAVLARLENLRTRLINAHAAQGSAARRMLHRLTHRGSAAPRGIYLWGPVGRGKTWLMDLFFQSLTFPERRRRHFHRFMHEVHAELKRLGEHASPLEVLAERIAADTRVLCFDELFVSDIADAMILGGLFDGLFSRGVTLVATSNSPPAELYRDGLQRQRFLPAIALLERHTEVVPVDGGSDYRLRQLTQAGTYLPSDAPDTAARLRALFDELAQHAEWNEAPLEINERPIPVVRHSDGAVWFGFEALCAGPRSADDYIEIARLYPTVLLEQVPRLDENRHDETRRFIGLVDELYDHNVKLVVSAAAAPDALYQGERLRFEFQRTTSRLIEMQSAEYLAREHLP
ncbi:MAG: cell division protein ZapE [Pseudomonadota bacterium]|jgi:cell division protein ZapE|nr:cell division protein ZapE [Pseudomonadota bacterium]